MRTVECVAFQSRLHFIACSNADSRHMHSRKVHLSPVFVLFSFHLCTKICVTRTVRGPSCMHKSWSILWPLLQPTVQELEQFHHVNMNIPLEGSCSAAHQGLKQRWSVLDSGSALDSISMCVNAVLEVIPTRVLEKLEHKLTFSLCSTRNNLSVLKHNRNTSPAAICRRIVKAKQRPGQSPHSLSQVLWLYETVGSYSSLWFGTFG